MFYTDFSDTQKCEESAYYFWTNIKGKAKVIETTFKIGPIYFWRMHMYISAASLFGIISKLAHEKKTIVL